MKKKEKLKVNLSLNDPITTRASIRKPINLTPNPGLNVILGSAVDGTVGVNTFSPPVPFNSFTCWYVGSSGWWTGFSCTYFTCRDDKGYLYALSHCPDGWSMRDLT